ncbi:MAG: leucine-rich repeat protein [Kiritimatiellia bacterium]
MKTKIMPHAVFTAFAALIAGAAFSATSYVVPWYVNPALRAQVRLGDEAPRVTSLALDPSGAFLALGAEANGAFENIQAYKAAELAAATGVVTNGFTGRLASSAAGLGEAPLVAVHAATGVVAVNADLSAGAHFPCGANRWIGRMAPEAVTFSAPEPVSAFAFNTEGTAAWANATSDGRTGLVVEWTFAQNVFTRGREIATGLSSVKGLGVYAYNGRTCVVVGEGDAAAATAGEIRLVDTASGVVATLLADRDHLGAGIVAVRMSHLGFFRPRLYALLATGDVVCYTCRPEKTSDPVLYSRTIPNADLLAAAQAPWTGDHAQVTAFEVFPDGGTAAVAYRRRADDATEPTGPAYLALLKHTPRRWTLYEKDDAGNPRLGVARTLTDGLWQLNYTWRGSGEIWIGFNDDKFGSAWVNEEMHEYLDFSGGVAYKASDGAKHAICGNYIRSLGTNAVSCGKGPRVLLHSPNMNDFGDKAKGWGGEGNFEEVVIDVPNLTWMASWSGPYTNQKYIIYNMPRLGEAPPVMLYANNGNYYGDLCRFEEQNFATLTIVRDRAFQNWNASGVLSLPKATVLSNDCFRSCRYMTEAQLGTTATATMQFFSAAFYGNTALKKVTLGSAGGVHFHAANVFANCPLEEVTLGGPVLTADDELSVVWPDTAERTMVFAVPRGDAAWEAVLADPNKLKTRLTEAEQEAFFVAHPGRHIPFGVVDKSVFRTHHDQLVAYNDQPGGCALTIERDTFFDDAVAVASDRAPTTDGRYMPGTTVTLTATPNATGAFRRWYGDVPGGVADQATLTLTLTNDVWLYCRFVHPWTLASDRKTASNGNFTVNCRVADASARTLALGNGKWGGLYAADDVGQGVCDLGGPVVLEGDATPWTFVSWGDAQGALCGLKHGTGAADTLLSPGTLRTMTEAQFLHHASTPDARSYRMFIFDEPTMTGTWRGWATCGHSDLTRLILRLPSLTAFAGDGCLWDFPLSETKFDWWDLRGLTTLTAPAWHGVSWTWRAPASGRLSLPALRTVVFLDMYSRSAALAKMPAVEAIALGGRTKADTVTNLCQGAFKSDTKLRSLTLYNGADLVVGANPLEGTPALREIWLQGPAPSGEAVSNLFSSVKAEATKPLKLYVSRLMKGWTTAAYLDAPTDAEKAEAPGEKVFAVYRGAGAAAGTGKALVIHRAGPYDPANTILYFR